MKPSDSLEELLKQYEDAKVKLIDAVGGSETREEIEHLKRQLEVIASKIRKIDVNRGL